MNGRHVRGSPYTIVAKLPFNEERRSAEKRWHRINGLEDTFSSVYYNNETIDLRSYVARESSNRQNEFEVFCCFCILFFIVCVCFLRPD